MYEKKEETQKLYFSISRGKIAHVPKMEKWKENSMKYYIKMMISGKTIKKYISFRFLLVNRKFCCRIDYQRSLYVRVNFPFKHMTQKRKENPFNKFFSHSKIIIVEIIVFFFVLAKLHAKGRKLKLHIFLFFWEYESFTLWESNKKKKIEKRSTTSILK